MGATLQRCSSINKHNRNQNNSSPFTNDRKGAQVTFCFMLWIAGYLVSFVYESIVLIIAFIFLCSHKTRPPWANSIIYNRTVGVQRECKRLKETEDQRGRLWRDQEGINRGAYSLLKYHSFLLRSPLVPMKDNGNGYCRKWGSTLWLISASQQKQQQNRWKEQHSVKMFCFVHHKEAKHTERNDIPGLGGVGRQGFALGQQVLHNFHSVVY